MPDLTFPSFNGGEVAPSFYGSTHQDTYFVSAKALHNYIASQTGPAIGRGGTVYTAVTRNGGKVLLVPFQFNEEQAYVAEFGDGYIRFYKDRGQINEDALTITGISQANPAVVTVNHNLTKGRHIRITGVAGMTEVNGRSFMVDHVLGSGVNITALARSSPAKITLAGGHGFVGGERVFVESVGGMTEVNNRTFELVEVESGIYSITGVTQANPAVVTISQSHTLASGDAVVIRDVAGMTALNNRRFTVAPKYSSTVNVSAVTKANPGVVTTGTNHGYDVGDRVLLESLGGMTQLNNREFTVGRSLQSGTTITALTGFGAGAPVGVFIDSHGYSTGDIVYIAAIGYATQLLGRTFTITVQDSDNFTLNGTDINTVSKGPAFFPGFYLESGTVNRVDKNKFTLVGEDTTNHTTYTSGGTSKERFLNQFELSGENSTGYGAYTGGGTATEVEANQFYLLNENALKHTAYTSGGTVKAVSKTSLKLNTLAGSGVDSSGYSAYSADGAISAVHEIASPYDIDDLFDDDEIPLLQFAQSADFLFLAHPLYPPMQLTRYGHADWEISEFINEEGPFLDENLGDTTIYVETSQGLGVGATVTLHASAPLFEQQHIGAMWEIRLKDDATTPIWTSATAFTLGAEVLSNDLFYRCTDAGTSGTEAPSHDVGEAYDGASISSNCKWLYIHNGRGIVIITGFTNSQTVTATVIAELPAGTEGATNATGRWKEGAWSDSQGFPRSVALHESRLVWGGTTQEPLALDFSNTESLFYYNPVEADGTVVRSSAFRRILDGDNPIRWMKSTEKGLIIGTLAGEWVVGTEGVTQGFGPDTAVARQFSANGAAAIQPIRNGDSLLYPQRSRKRMRDITFSIDQQKLVTSDRNLRADHIALEGICDIAYAEEPHRVTWCRLSDGKIVGLTYNREPGAQVSAWHNHKIAGSFGDGDAIVESIAVIPGPDETTDDLWLSVKRTIDGNTVRYIEWMARPLDYGEPIEDGIFTDSTISYSGSPITTVTGLDHLEGQEVTVLADGLVFEHTVEDGAITLETAASKIHVGLYALRYIETAFLESAPGDSLNTKAQTKRVASVQIEVIESAKGWIGTDPDYMDQMVFDEFYTEDCPRRYTGFVEETINDDYARRKNVRFEQREPYPSMITSITARFEVSS